MEKMVQLGSPARSRRRAADKASSPLEADLDGPRQHHLAQGGSGSVHLPDGVGHHGGVALGGHGGGHAGDPGHAAFGGLRRGGAVLPDDGVEELVGVGQGEVGRPDRGRPTPGHAVGVARGPHGEARHDEIPAERVGERERPQGDGSRPQGLHGVLARDGGQGGRRLGGGDEQRRAPAHQRQPGPVEEHGRAAIELQRVGPVLERDGAGVQRGARRRRYRRRHGVPVRVATTIWLRPPARGRIPTAEKPASRSMARRTGVGGR